MPVDINAKGSLSHPNPAIRELHRHRGFIWLAAIAGLFLYCSGVFYIGQMRGARAARESLSPVFSLAERGQFDQIGALGLAPPDVAAHLRTMEARYGRLQSWRMRGTVTDLGGNLWQSTIEMRWERLEAMQHGDGSGKRLFHLVDEQRPNDDGETAEVATVNQARQRAQMVLHRFIDGTEIKRLDGVRKVNDDWLITCSTSKGRRYLVLDDEGRAVQYLRAKISDYPPDPNNR